MTRKLSQLSLRDFLFVVLPMLLVIGLAFWGAAQFVKPAPPSRLVISSGGESGAYHLFALRYKDVLSQYGIEVVIKTSGGSTENLARLRNAEFEVDAAFVQGGTARMNENDDLVSLGDFYYEPAWVFYRAAAGAKPLDSLGQLKGRRIAIGGAGSGTQHLARELLAANGMDAGNTQLVEKGGIDAVERLNRGEIDAVIAVGPTQSAVVWSLLYSPGIQLMSHVHAAAYNRRLPYLSPLMLPRGGIDIERDIPPHDVQLMAPTTTLVVRGETHPALIDLLMLAAAEVHGGPGVFQRPGEFPRAGHGEFPLSKEAERFYKSGRPFLQRYLPFWAATLIDRMVVMLVPLIAVLVPLFKLAPAAYNWRVRSRIFRYYGELKFLESELTDAPTRFSREDWLQRLDTLEAAVNRLSTPLAFTDMLYTLREHIRMVRESVLIRVPASDNG